MTEVGEGTRFRHSLMDGRVTTTHCTVDTGEGTSQTAITFRSWDGGCDLLVVSRPIPRSGNSSCDSGQSVRLA